MSTGRARGRARRADGAWRCFFSASAVLAVVVVGIPALLVACSRAGLGTTLPFPGIGSADEIRAFFERELTTTELVPIAVRALLIVGWLLWVALVSSVVASMFEARGRRAVGIPRLAMFAGIGRWIAAGLTALVTLAPSAAAGAPVARAPAVSLVSNPVPVARTGGEPAVARPVPAGFARVQAGESIETFAERTLGAPGRWVDVWELNQQRAVGAHGEVWTAPWRLSAGWDLRLPITRPAADATAATTRNAAITGAHVVAAGDSYWEIAESLLAPGAAPGEVLDYTEALVAANAPRLGYADPNMLHPGDVLDIVAPPTTTTAPGGTTGPADPTPMATSHRVQPGDSYWAIADAALGDSAAPADVAELTRYLIDLNAPRLGYDDVRMIHPGDEVQLGNAALAPIEVSSEMPLPPPATASATAVFDSLWDETAPAPTATTTAATSSTTATTTASTSSTTTPAPVPAQPGDAGDGGGAARPSSSPSPIGVGEAALLATGIVALIGARRRAAAARGGSPRSTTDATGRVRRARARTAPDRQPGAPAPRRRGTARGRAGDRRAQRARAARARRRRRHDRGRHVRPGRAVRALGAQRDVVVAAAPRARGRAGRRRSYGRRAVRRTHHARRRRQRVRDPRRHRGDGCAGHRCRADGCDRGRRGPRRSPRAGGRDRSGRARRPGVVGVRRGRPAHQRRARRRSRLLARQPQRQCRRDARRGNRAGGRAGRRAGRAAAEHVRRDVPAAPVARRGSPPS